MRYLNMTDEQTKNYINGNEAEKLAIVKTLLSETAETATKSHETVHIYTASIKIAEMTPGTTCAWDQPKQRDKTA